jgi:hypothetical protein
MPLRVERPGKTRPDLLRLWKGEVRDRLPATGPLPAPPMLFSFHMPPSHQRGRDHKQLADAVALILIIVPLGLSGFGRQHVPSFQDVLFARLIPANQGSLRLLGPLVDLPDILQGADQFRIALRWNAPLLFQPRLELVFLNRPHRFGRNTLENLELNHLVGPPQQCPSLTTVWCLRTGQRNPWGLLLAIELPISRPASLLPT